MSSKQKILIGIVIVVLVVIVFAGKVIGWRNQLVVLDEQVKKSWSNIDNQLQRRMDLIPNLVETVKGYASHEKEVLTQITEARAKVAGAASTKDKVDANNELSSVLSRLLVVVENYPDLKANQNFLSLQDELSGTENRIAVERRRYNEAVGQFNTTRRKFPYMIFAGQFPEAVYFEASPKAAEAPKVSF
ncbi:MAG TPA: LemA family protein [Chitinispirillaceae bacterium]|mgnify:CR=1 FL=1|jgi:LemA protein|nr:LemA family protein [Chitinispirillaceae bacterium]